MHGNSLKYFAKNTKSSGARRRVPRNKSPTNHIPSLISDPVQNIVQRYFVSDTASTDVISLTFELPVAPFGVSISSSSLALPFKAIRLKWIKLWCMYRPEKGIQGNTVNMTIVDRRTVRPLEWTGTAAAFSNAAIKMAFKPSDPIGFWYITTSGESNPEVRVQLPKGAVMDISFDYILDDRETNSGTSTGSSLSSPRVYYNRLSTDLELAGKTNTAVIVM